MSTLLDGWNAGLARTLAAVREATDKMYTYNPKTAGKQISATVSNGKAPQLKTKPVVKEVVKKQPANNTPKPTVVLPEFTSKQDVINFQKTLGFTGKDLDGIVGPKTNAAANKAGINLAMTNADAYAPRVVITKPVQTTLKPKNTVENPVNVIPPVPVVSIKDDSQAQTQGLAKVAAEEVGEGLFTVPTDDKAIYDEFKAKQKASAGNEDAVANSDKKIADINADYLAMQNARTLASRTNNGFR